MKGEDLQKGDINSCWQELKRER